MNPEFSVHTLNEKGIEKSKEIANIFDAALTGLMGHCPEGRQFSIAKTKLEESCFFAKKAMAMHPDNQKAQ